MRKPLIIFDCDGVLVDSEYIFCSIDAEELTKAGYPVTTAEYIRRLSGRSSESIYNLIENETGKKLTDDFRQDVWEKIQRAYAERLQPMPAVENVLAAITDKCVASGGSLQKINLSLTLTKLDSYFAEHQIFSAAMVDRGKPAPDLFLFAANHMGFAPENCIVIEDSLPGVKAGKAAGMKTFGFVGGDHILDNQHATMLKNAGADLVFDDMDDLVQLINSN